MREDHTSQATSSVGLTQHASYHETLNLVDVHTDDTVSKHIISDQDEIVFNIEEHESSIILLTDENMMFPNNDREYREKLLTFGAAMLCCSCGGSIMLFSLYAPQFQTDLGYTQVQVNVLSMLSEVGMYMTTPIVGIAADIYGSSMLALAAAFFFILSYATAAWAYSMHLPYFVMMFSFLFIGCGTACIYFGSITACAKTFSHNRGLALGLPITAYGVSSLWESQLTGLLFIDHETGYVHVAKFFIFFSVFLGTVGVVASFGYRFGYAINTSSQQRKLKTSHTQDVSEATEENALLEVQEDSQILDIANDESSNEVTRKQMIAEFLKDATAWGLAFGLFTTTGPGEMFLNNMGSIIKSLGPGGPKATTNVSIISFSSSISRILAGGLADAMDSPRSKVRISKMWLMLFFAFLLAFGHLFVALGGLDVNNGSLFWLVSILLGTGYGAIFTLAPTIVSIVWGAERFGTNWGVLFLFPATGTIVYEAIYAAIYDRHTINGNLCFGEQCYHLTFVITAISCLMAIFTWALVWRLGWARRHVTV
ncbi:major facilitator superfamily domain-containing protein [Dipodascopsis uninucleata]